MQFLNHLCLLDNDLVDHSVSEIMVIASILNVEPPITGSDDGISKSVIHQSSIISTVLCEREKRPLYQSDGNYRAFTLHLVLRREVNTNIATVRRIF